MTDENLQKIRNYLSVEELLAALAEEASELAQASLKLRRAIDGHNVTPKGLEECEANLREEISDVKIILKTLGYDDVECDKFKIRRWITRLEDDGK